MTEEKPDQKPVRPAGDTAPDVPVLHVRDLLANSREAVLIHEGERYRLRITAKDKLILTK